MRAILARAKAAIRLGQPYAFLPESATWGTEKAPRPAYGFLYVPLRIALNVRMHQWLVVYDGLTGPDAGLAYVCTLSDWESNFQLAPQPAPEERMATDGSLV